MTLSDRIIAGQAKMAPVTLTLTPAQQWALVAIWEGHGGSPAQLGQRMMERPGATPQHRGSVPYKSQGYGRMGAGMSARLQRAGLVYTVGWPTETRLTPHGRALAAALVAAVEGENNG